MQGYLIGALFFILAIAVFVYQNTDQVVVYFLTWTSPKISIALVVLISACTGALITFFIDSVRQFKIARKIKELTDQNKKLQKKLQKYEANQSGSLDNKKSSDEAAASKES
ncbi:MAG: DUF1049 domain-containing protein [Syntrophomonadaceae bacterium]|nr:DUF1049 domain-containing protein [Syntrophomonadaceae bacterium]